MHRLVHWLIPASPFRETLESAIRELALEHEAPVFAPHVTLGAVAADDEAGLEKTWAELRRTPVIRLTPAGIGTGDSFTHCLFLEFKASEELDELMAVFPLGTGIEPHLSLLYGPPGMRGRALEHRVSPLLEVIEFDQVWQVPMSGAIVEAADVETWRPSGRIPLHSSGYEQ